MYEPRCFSNYCLCAGSWASEFVHATFKSRICFLQPSSSPRVKPCWSGKSDVMGAHPPVKSPGLKSMMWGVNSLLLREDLHTCNIPPACGLPCQGCGYQPDHVSAPSVLLDVFFLYIFSCGTAVLLVLRLFSEEVPYAVVALVCLWRELRSGFPYSAVLVLLPLFSFFHFCVITCCYFPFAWRNLFGVSLSTGLLQTPSVLHFL